MDKWNERWAENAERKKKLFQKLKWTIYFKISAKKQTLNLGSLENKVRVKCWKTTNKKSWWNTKAYKWPSDLNKEEWCKKIKWLIPLRKEMKRWTTPTDFPLISIKTD